jgi:hypothetical protein
MERWIEYVVLDAVTEADRNAKAHNVEGVVASMEAFGHIEPQIIDDRTNKLVAGHGRLKALRAMREAGHPAPRGVVVTDEGVWTVPVVHGWASENDDEAHAAGITLNQQTIAGGWDIAELDSMLADARKMYDDAVLGFEPFSTEAEERDVSPQLNVSQSWSIVIACEDEAHQTALLERFITDGLSAKAVFG